MRCDVVIVGGGIVGLATARAIAHRWPGRSLLVLEKEPRVAAHQSGRNSGVIHSGLYYRPGSVKARLAVEGARRMVAFCREHGVAHAITGKVVVATCERELPALTELARRGRENGVPGVEEIGRERLAEIEPHARGVRALWVPGTGVVDFATVAGKIVELLRAAGAQVRLGVRFLALRRDGDRAIVATTDGEIEARAVINCAGLHSDRVAAQSGDRPDARIVPFRGEYYRLAPDAESLVRGLIYPVPDSRFPFLGVHFTRLVGGGVEAGPNAVLAFSREGTSRAAFDLGDALATLGYGGFWRMAARHARTGLSEQWRSISKRAFVRALRVLVPEIETRHLAAGGAGVRAQALAPDGALVDDFRIVRGARAVHVLNAPSPAATASLAIGERIADLAAELVEE